MIKGMYRLPAIKHIFFIMSSLEDSEEMSIREKDRKKRRAYFEHILLSKDHKFPRKTQHWSLKSIAENDLLMVLKEHTPKGQVSSNLSFHNPECLELLAINLIKTPDKYSVLAQDSIKHLGIVPDEDIIEVFI